MLTAHLSSPLIMQGCLTLDALLMAILGRGDVAELLKCEDGLYYASAAIQQDQGITLKASFVASMRPDTTPQWGEVLGDIAFHLKKQRQGGNVVSGYQAVVTPKVEWHATGHAQAVLDVVKDIMFIGKRRSSGYGQVARWEVGPSDFDGLSAFGEPLRPVPVERWALDAGDLVVVDAAWKAPYWDIRNRGKCFVPPRSA